MKVIFNCTYFILAQHFPFQGMVKVCMYTHYSIIWHSAQPKWRKRYLLVLASEAWLPNINLSAIFNEK